MIPLSPALRRFIDQMLCCFVAGPSNIDPTASYTMADLTLTDDLTVGDDATVTGTLTAGDVTVTTSLTAADVTVTDDLVVTDDVAVSGVITYQTVAQPLVRMGDDTLAGGTVVIPAAWVTAGTRFQLTYTGGAAVADALSWTKIDATSFTVFGTGNNTFTWVAFVPVT